MSGKRIVLVGNPNVGKSVIFSQLTGTKVFISNYPGTTVEFTRGELHAAGEVLEVIDSPGTYSLEPTCRAEEVTAGLVDKADIVINVVNATNLERNLYLTSQLLERKVPLIVVLNMVDEARHQGISIDTDLLQEKLGVPVIPTVAISGQGLDKLIDALPAAVAGGAQALASSERWSAVGRLVEQVQRVTHRHQTLIETLQLASLKPWTGVPLAAAVLYLTFKTVIGLGELIQEGLLRLFFNPLYLPLLAGLSARLGGRGFWHDLVIGTLDGGEICLEESMGLLTTGVFVAFGIVLPFITVFFLVLGFLEDCGYLPRLAVMVDRVMHRIGLHGYSAIPIMLGFGCNVPAVLAARNLDSRRERFIACTLMSVAVPCMAQIAAIFGLVGRYGGVYLGVVFATLFLLAVTLGLLLDRLIPGFTPSMVIEVPPYRWPHAASLFKKLGMRIHHFFTHALPYIFGGILFMNLLYLSGAIDYLGALFAPVAEGMLGLPRASVSTLLMGFLRKDVAVAMLVPLGLSARQFVIGATVLAVYFPCAATFTVLARELGAKDMALSAAVMLLSAASAGTFLNLFLDRLLPPTPLALLMAALAVFLALVAGGTSDRRELSGGQKHHTM